MSDSTASEILDTLMKNLQQLVSTKTVVGEPVQAGKTTILPVMKVTMGFGAGGGTVPGKAQSQGGGGGGGISITPIGFLVVEEGKTMMVSPGQPNKWEWLVESIPEIWEKLSKMRSGAGEKKEEKGAATSSE